MADALLDSVTGQPFPPKGNATTGAALVEMTDVNINTDGLATEDTLDGVLAALSTPVPALPPTPLMTPGDFTGSEKFSYAAIQASVLLVAGVAGQVIRVYRHDHLCAAAQRVAYYDGDPSVGGTLIRGWSYSSANGGGENYDLDGRAYFKTTAGNGLYLKLTTNAQTDGAIDYGQV